IARWSVAETATTLPLEPDLRAVVHACRHGDHHFLLDANFARAAARRAPLARNGTFSKTHGARPLNREAALAKRDRSASLTLGTCLDLGAGGSAVAVTRRALLVDLEL